MIDVTFLVQILGLVLNFVCAYYAFLFLNSFRKPRVPKRVADINPHPPRFAVLIPAHNEEVVVGDILRDLLNQSYPKDYYKIIVVGDHCTDRTKEIVEYYGNLYNNVIFLERQSGERGKNHALQYALDLLSEEDFDLLTVIDADNRVELDFLRKIIIYFTDPDVHAVQAYVATKNPNETLITKLIYYENLILQRLWQMTKPSIKLSPALAGTGETFRMSTIKKLGWGNLLTEDLEQTTKLILQGKKIIFAHDIRTYDEKPQTLWKAYKQRRRWALGHMQTCKKYLISCIKSFVFKGNVKALDNALYLLFQFNPFIIFGSIFLSILSRLGVIYFQSRPLIVLVFGSFSFLFILLAIAIRERQFNIFKYILPFHFFLFLWVVVDFAAIKLLLTKGYVWERTPHGMSKSDSPMKTKLILLLCILFGAITIVGGVSMLFELFYRGLR